MMRSRLAARSTRLVLAAAVVTALAATSTACSSDDVQDTSSSSAPSAGSDGGSSSTPSSGDSVSASAPGSTSSPTSGDADDKTAGSGDGGGEKSGYGQSCGTNDLDFTVTSETQAGGYYLVTAKAKSGITCYLDVNTPSVSFGSGTDGVASPVGQGGADPIKLSGASVAYTGISPKSTNSEGGKEFENVIIATTNDDPDPAELKLPDTATVDKPIVTNWATDRAEAVPSIV